MCSTYKYLKGANKKVEIPTCLIWGTITFQTQSGRGTVLQTRHHRLSTSELLFGSYSCISPVYQSYFLSMPIIFKWYCTVDKAPPLISIRVLIWILLSDHARVGFLVYTNHISRDVLKLHIPASQYACPCPTTTTAPSHPQGAKDKVKRL